MAESKNHKKNRPHSKWKKLQNKLKAIRKYQASPKRKKKEEDLGWKTS
jgi:hypothetical protein